MVGKIAIILLVFLSQINVFPRSVNNFLKSFAEKETIQGSFGLQGESLFYHIESLGRENKLYSLPYKIRNATAPDISAKSAIVFDVETDTTLYSKNSNEKLRIASLTKIMTALIVLEKDRLNNVAVVSKNAVDSVEGRKDKMKAGEKIKVEDLLKIMLIDSNNHAAVSLAEHTSGDVNKFVDLMNEKAESLGLKNTHFFNVTGLDGEHDNYSTAYEIARLVDYSLEQSLIWDILGTRRTTVFSFDMKTEHNLKNTNMLLGKMKNVVGGKTGFTDGAGQCLALVVKEPIYGRRVISVVLDADDRFVETERLVNWVFGNYRW